MSIQAASFRRLKEEAWNQDPMFLKALEIANAKPQPLAAGNGKVVLDDYSILIEKMPSGATPNQFLRDMLMNLNSTINDRGFDRVNVFFRRSSGSIQIGDVYDIDIPVDNGSVALAVLDTDYFVFHTIESKKYGTHPECGSREFGFEYVGDLVRIYTRGVSRAANLVGSWGGTITHYAGKLPQIMGWTRLMKGISNTIYSRGGKPKEQSFGFYRKEED